MNSIFYVFITSDPFLSRVSLEKLCASQHYYTDSTNCLDHLLLKFDVSAFIACRLHQPTTAIYTNGNDHGTKLSNNFSFNLDCLWLRFYWVRLNIKKNVRSNMIVPTRWWSTEYQMNEQFKQTERLFDKRGSIIISFRARMQFLPLHIYKL